jgi:hypothetical protein
MNEREIREGIRRLSQAFPPRIKKASLVCTMLL